MIAKIDREVARRDGVVELPVAEPVQYGRERARARVEHEEPDDHARSARERSGDVEEESEERADALRVVVEHQRERHDEDRLADQPDRHELEHVLEGRHEAVVVEGIDEARAETARIAEGEVDRVDDRRDAEQQQQAEVEGDEEVPRRRGSFPRGEALASLQPGFPGGRLRVRRGQPVPKEQSSSCWRLPGLVLVVYPLTCHPALCAADLMFPASVVSAELNVPPAMRPGVTLFPKMDSTLHGTGLQPVQISAAAVLMAASVADGLAKTPSSDLSHASWSGA